MKLLPRIDDPEREWADKILGAWRQSVEGIFEVGRLLIDAKAALLHGGFEIMVRDKLPFNKSAAERLMKLSRNPELTNPANLPVLPASWTTLYELSKFDEQKLRVAFDKRLIHPTTRGQDIPEIAARVEGRRVRAPAKPAPAPRSFFLDLRQALEPSEIEALQSLGEVRRARLVRAIQNVIQGELCQLSPP